MNHLVEVIRTIYPRLPDIPDQHPLTYLPPLDSKERAFTDEAGTPKSRYPRAFYLKGIYYFGHFRVYPGDLPRIMRLKMAEELGQDNSLADILKIHPVETSKVVVIDTYKWNIQRPFRFAGQTKRTCISYHRAASLLLAIGFSSQLNHALQGGFFSLF